MIFDIADIDKFKEKIEIAASIFGKIDILVNSAGIHTENVDFFTMTSNEYDRVMDVNIKGVYFICKEFVEYMKKHKAKEKKHILLISSSRGSEPAWSPYGVSKWALNGLTKGLAQLLLPYGIIVNAIAPGSTATELIGVKAGDSINSQENGNNRLIMPVEVANIAKMLVSSSGDMIVGEIIHVSGGRGVFDIR
jgi:3-oxoacyl-[acyl-carrier protein] reductase